MPHESAHLERSVQIGVAAMCALGTLLLGLGQMSVFLPCIAILSAVGSIVITDTLRSFRLNRGLANLAALLAVAYTAIPIVLSYIRRILFPDAHDYADTQTSLIAVANLLVYLQIILQFQQKNLRIYWSLSVLSLLQVVVASALNLSVAFGPLLAVYLVVALTAMSLLFVFRETLRFVERTGPVVAAPGPRRRWPLAGGRISFSGAGEDLVRPMLGRSLVRHVGAMCLLTLLVAALVFFGVPRFDRNAWQSAAGRAAAITGFSDQVSLGQMGRILQSNEEVMRVTFRDLDSATAFRVSGETYLRGATLTSYKRGNWSSGPDDRRIHSLLAPRPFQDRVVQDVTLDVMLRTGRAGRYSSLFSTFPVFRNEDEPSTIQLDVNPQRRQLLLDNTSVAEVVPQFHYAVRSGAFRGKRMKQFTPETLSVGATRQAAIREIGRLTLNEQAAMPTLVATAQSAVDEARAQTPIDKAQALEAHFTFPGRYDYTLDRDVKPEPNIDLVEDFVKNNRTGHCEYFASALVLMLRSQGIPARMVVGYKSGDWNSVGSYYQFRERHAHAWVEAFVAPADLPASEKAGDDLARNNGAWMRLDPTPADYDAEAELADIGIMSRIGDMIDYVQILWDEYVLGLNSQKQQESVYQPILARINGLLNSLRGGGIRSAWMAGLPPAIVALLAACAALWLAARRRVTMLPGGGRIASLIAGPTRWVERWVSRRWGRPRRRAAVRVEFYGRLERILRAQGLARQPGQTQREFAEAAGGALADAPHLQSVAGVPRRVAGAFYDVRFGRRTLDNSEQQAVEQALADLESALAKRGKKKEEKRAT